MGQSRSRPTHQPPVPAQVAALLFPPDAGTLPTPRSQPPTEASPSRASLLALPAELRNSIWAYALTSSTELVTAGTSRIINSAVQPPLTRVNRQVRNGTLATFYSTNAFCLNFSTTASARLARAWATSLGPHRQHLQTLIITSLQAEKRIAEYADLLKAVGEPVNAVPAVGWGRMTIAISPNSGATLSALPAVTFPHPDEGANEEDILANDLQDYIFVRGWQRCRLPSDERCAWFTQFIERVVTSSEHE